jgi:hypothetical protein
MIDENCFITLSQIQKVLAAEPYNLRVALSTIHNCIHSFSYSFKRVSTVAVAANTPALELERLQFSNWAVEMALDQRVILYIDESGFNMSIE